MPTHNYKRSLTAQERAEKTLIAIGWEKADIRPVVGGYHCAAYFKGRYYSGNHHDALGAALECVKAAMFDFWAKAS